MDPGSRSASDEETGSVAAQKGYLAVGKKTNDRGYMRSYAEGSVAAQKGYLADRNQRPSVYMRS